jgi:hypothetical protein
MSLRRTSLKRRGKPLAGLLLGVAACAWLGCQTALNVPPETALDKLLRPVATSPDSVTLEIWEARVPLDKDRVAEGLWQEIDEQQLDAELRGRLLANGLRAGVLSGSLPDELADLLGLTGDPPPAESGNAIERVITADSATPAVTRSVVQVNRQAPRSVPMTATQDEAVVLINDGGSVGGEAFKLVDGRYEVRA